MLGLSSKLLSSIIAVLIVTSQAAPECVGGTAAARASQLQNNAQARSYCAANYPIPRTSTVTKTAAAITVTSTTSISKSTSIVASRVVTITAPAVTNNNVVATKAITTVVSTEIDTVTSLAPAKKKRSINNLERRQSTTTTATTTSSSNALSSNAAAICTCLELAIQSTVTVTATPTVVKNVVGTTVIRVTSTSSTTVTPKVTVQATATTTVPQTVTTMVTVTSTQACTDLVSPYLGFTVHCAASYPGSTGDTGNIIENTDGWTSLTACLNRCLAVTDCIIADFNWQVGRCVLLNNHLVDNPTYAMVAIDSVHNGRLVGS